MNSCLGNQGIDETHNPLQEPLPTIVAIGSPDPDHDIEMGELLSADECTICFSDIPSNTDRTFGCGNPKCNGKFCDDCIMGLSERYIHNPRCCNCTEPCGAMYTSRLNRIQIVLFVYNGNHYMVVKSTGSTITQFKLITSPVVDANITTFRTAYLRATDLLTDDSITTAFNRIAHNTQWLHDVDNVRWGKLIHTTQRYVTVNYYMIYLMNNLVAAFMFGIMFIFSKQMFSSDSNLIDMLCLFVNIVVTIASYWLFMLQILYNDVNVLSKNMIRWRVLIFGASTAIIISNNVLMLERTLGDGQDIHVAMYVLNFSMHACVAMWTKRLAIGD